MNALTKFPPTVPSQRKTFAKLCRNARWNLLQQFAELEIRLTKELGAASMPMFGPKLQHVAQERDFGDTKALIATRNLVAHAHVDIVESKQGWISIWRVAEKQSGLEARILDGEELKAWELVTTTEIKRLLALLKRP